MKTNIILFVLSLVSFLFLTGCENTASGFGKDMEQNGQAIQKAINSDNGNKS